MKNKTALVTGGRGTSTLMAMINRHYGRIINISSINGQNAQFEQANYSASKTLAQEVPHKGVAVDTISPGYIATSMVMSVAKEIREKICANPGGRLGHPEEVAHIVALSASDASGFITGSNLTINGGQYLI